MVYTRQSALSRKSVTTQTDCLLNNAAVQVSGSRECLSLLLPSEGGRGAVCVRCEQVVSLGGYRLSRESALPGVDHCSLVSGRQPLKVLFLWAGGKFCALCPPRSPSLRELTCPTLLTRHALVAALLVARAP